MVRREFPYHRWEPIYIGTNQEPLYSEQLTWEGQQDKMTQVIMKYIRWHLVLWSLYLKQTDGHFLAILGLKVGYVTLKPTVNI